MRRTSTTPLRGQVVVVTGGSSGIGLASALALARRGARLVLAARGSDALDRAADEVRTAGGEALAVPTDVAEWEQVEALAARAVAQYGRIDTWVGNAAVTAFGLLEDLGVEEVRRVLDVGLLGQFHGVKAVLPHMRRQGAGTIIAVSSGLGARSVPLQAPYCAAKAGVIALMDALRVELELEATGIRATTILPSAINTPLFEQAATRLGMRPPPIPPVYEPEAVAEAVVHAAEHPVRDIVVGGAGKALIASHRLAPRLTDRALLLGARSFASQRTGSSRASDPGNLFEPGRANALRGPHGRFAFGSSRYSRAFEHHPALRRAALAAVVVLAAGRVRR